MTSDGGMKTGSSSSRPPHLHPRDPADYTNNAVQPRLDGEDGQPPWTRYSGDYAVLSGIMDGAQPANEPFSKRRNSKRLSGGFLLGGSLGRAKRHLAPVEGKLKTWQGRLRDGVEGDDDVSTTSPRSARSAKSQGKAPLHGEGYGLDGNSNTLPRPKRTSVGNSEEGSWTPPVRSDRGSGMSQTSVTSTGSASIDPNQLIQMALSLSEGRRRAASGVYTPPAVRASRRVASHGGTIAAVPPGSPLANDTVRRSRMKRLSVAPGAIRGPEQFDDTEQEPAIPATTSDWSNIPSVTYDFSISSLQRAERAKKYFEVAHHYRRFLQTLSPLESHVTGSPDGPSHTGGGRRYNPLQYLRNERLRRNLETHLNPDPADFDDIEKVAAFVDATEQNLNQSTASGPSNLGGLPSFHQFSRKAETTSNARHSRNNTASSRILWFDSNWSVTPMALFADTIWSEDPRHRWALENRHGQKIFPELQPQSLELNHRSSMHRQVSGKRARANTLEDQQSGHKAAQSRGRHKRKFLSIHKFDNDTGKKLHWHRGRSQSSSRGSSQSSVSAFGTFGNANADGLNIGPLARHMRKEMQQADADDASDMLSPDDRWDGLPLESTAGDSSIVNPYFQRDRLPRPRPRPLELRRSHSFSEGVNDSFERYPGYDSEGTAETPMSGGMIVRSATEQSGHGILDPAPDNLSLKLPRDMHNGVLLFSDAGKHNIEQMDFATPSGKPVVIQSAYNSDNDRERRSFESARSVDIRRHPTNTSITSLRRNNTHDSTMSNKTDKSHNKTFSRILKGGRLAELVRGDGVRKGERDLRRDRQMHSSQTALADEGGDISDHEDEIPFSRVNTNASTMDGPKHHTALPSFKFPNGIDAPRDNIDHSSDPITQQQEARKEQSMLSRHNSKRLLQIDIPSGKKGTKDASKDHSSPAVRGLLSPIKRLRSMNSSRSAVTSPAPSTMGSSLSLVTTEQSSRLPAETDFEVSRKRRWSIADNLERVTSNRQQCISMRDVERVRALFLSSGIKAYELHRRANTPPDQPLELLSDAASETGKEIGTVVRKDEYRTAGRLWHEAITGFQEASEIRLKDFREKATPEMRDKLENLRHVVGERLNIHVQTTGDEADAFAADLSTRQTLAIKTVHDTIDGLLRGRRRKFRWLRRIAFFMLEWLVVAIMWCFWFTFVLIRLVKGTVRGGCRAIGWLLWV